MEYGLTWKDIKSRIAQDDIGKVDYLLPIENVRMDGNTGRIFNNQAAMGSDYQLGQVQHSGLYPNDHSLGQLFGRLGMNIPYFRRAFEKNPYLAAEHVNYWIETGDIPRGEVSERAWLVRAKNDMMRALLTDRYGQVDNAFAFDSLSHVINEDTAVDIKGFSLDDRFLNTRMIFKEMRMNVGTDIKPDYVFVGIHFVNSEVGSSSVRIESCLYRQVCSNGLIVRAEGEILLRQRHSGITRVDLERKVAEALEKAIRSGDSIVDAYARTKEVQVSDPISLIKDLAKNQKYSQATTDNILNSYYTEPGDNLFSVINSFTHAAKSLDVEKRLEMETFAGKVMSEYSE